MTAWCLVAEGGVTAGGAGRGGGGGGTEGNDGRLWGTFGLGRVTGTVGGVFEGGGTFGGGGTFRSSNEALRGAVGFGSIIRSEEALFSSCLAFE